jgi:glycosyl transferase family 25
MYVMNLYFPSLNNLTDVVNYNVVSRLAKNKGHRLHIGNPETEKYVTVSYSFLVNSKDVLNYAVRVVCDKDIVMDDWVFEEDSKNLLRDLVSRNSVADVTEGYVKGYDLSNTWVVLWDCRSIISLPERAAGQKLAIIAWNYEFSKILKPQIELVAGSVPPSKIDLLTIGTNSFQLLDILSKCKKHIIMGNYVALLGAQLANTNIDNVWVSTPPGETLTINSFAQIYTHLWDRSRYFQMVYYINLKHRNDRRQHMDNQLKKLGIRPLRVEAVDGKGITWKPEYGITSRFWNRNAFAFCISYRQAIIDAVNRELEYCLIMEDDAVLQDNFYEILDKAWKELPQDWHMLYLGANHNKGAIPGENERIGDHIYRLKGSLGSHAIIIHKRCFRAILEFLGAPFIPFDSFLSNYQKLCPCYITYPGLASQLAGQSDIIGQVVDYTKDWGIDYIEHIPSRKENFQKEVIDNEVILTSV